MLSTEELIEQASSLPVEDRTAIIDSLLKTVNPMDDGIDRERIKIAKRRLHELRAGIVKPVPGELVFQKVKDRFSK